MWRHVRGKGIGGGKQEKCVRERGRDRKDGSGMRRPAVVLLRASRRNPMAPLFFGSSFLPLGSRLRASSIRQSSKSKLLYRYTGKREEMCNLKSGFSESNEHVQLSPRSAELLCVKKKKKTEPLFQCSLRLRPLPPFVLKHSRSTRAVRAVACEASESPRARRRGPRRPRGGGATSPFFRARSEWWLKSKTSREREREESEREKTTAPNLACSLFPLPLPLSLSPVFFFFFKSFPAQGGKSAVTKIKSRKKKNTQRLKGEPKKEATKKKKRGPQ